MFREPRYLQSLDDLSRIKLGIGQAVIFPTLRLEKKGDQSIILSSLGMLKEFKISRSPFRIFLRENVAKALEMQNIYHVKMKRSFSVYSLLRRGSLENNLVVCGFTRFRIVKRVKKRATFTFSYNTAAAR